MTRSYEILFFTFPGENYLWGGGGGGGAILGRHAKKAETKPKIINPYQHQISKQIYQPIFKAALFEFDCILFKILQLKNIPKPYSQVRLT